MMAGSTKNQTRQQYLEKRLALTGSERTRIDDLLLIRFQQFPLPRTVDRVLSFWPLVEKGEPNSFLLTDFLQFRHPGTVLCYPVTDMAGRQMQAVQVDDDTRFVLNKWGIAEPAGGMALPAEQLDLVLVPLLAFDLNGNRLGYGGGFYDRFLPRCRGNCIFLGISQFPPLEALPELAEYDIPLTACITPERIYEF
ncbi:MAG: 5-formyltetrahydrofolate cyclo-ligase [Flavihumibacter sp.]